MFLEVEKYPNNYSFLQNEDQKKIIDWFNKKQYTAELVLKQYYDLQNTADVAKSFKKIYEERKAEIRSVKLFLENFNIMMEYDWPGHREEWILATYNDALNHEDWLFQCAE